MENFRGSLIMTDFPYNAVFGLAIHHDPCCLIYTGMVGVVKTLPAIALLRTLV